MSRLAGIVVITTCAFAAQGRDIHYGAVTYEELLACDEQHWAGQVEAARACYGDLLQTSDQAGVLAEAYWALDDLQGANTMFQEAVRRFPDDPVLRVRWGELFIDTYQDQEAMGLFSEALEIEPDNAWAMVGAASLLARSFESESGQMIEDLGSGVPAGAEMRALLLAAQISLEASVIPEARKILDQAEQIAEKNDFPLLEIYALRASADFLELRDYSEWIDKALAANPSWGGIYAIPGYFSWITRRYREAADFYEKAIELEPDLWEAHLELGVNLLRDNKVTRARGHIEASYDGDPYNPKTVNTLRLLDTFGDYHVLTVPETPAAGELPELILRLHEDESDVLKGYVTELATASLREFSERYDFTPAEPVIVELYPNHEDFVVRTTGMPGLGILGATFGYLLAMDSPTGNPESDYHWGTTLWHEMAHVITLEATNHLVPRWFSEGVSVYEEWRSGPVPGMKIPLSVYIAVSEDKFLPIAELDGGFVRPTYPNQVIVSYMQAGLICEMIAGEFGDQALIDMLAEYAEGRSTTEAIENVLALSPAEFDERFDAFVEASLGDVVAVLPEWIDLQTQIQSAIDTEDWEGVARHSAAAIEQFPAYVESGSPYVALAIAHDELGQEDESTTVMETYWKKGGYDPGLLRKLGTRLRESGRNEEAIEVLAALNYINPFDADLHSELGDLLLESGKPEQALLEYEVLLAMQPLDRAAVHYQLASAWFELEDFDSTRSHLLQALDIAPRYREAQKLLLELAEARN